MRRFVGLSVLCCLVSFSAVAGDDKEKNPDDIGNRDVGKGLNWYSQEKEIALGKQMAQQVERQAKIIDDPVVAEYVNRVGQNLVRNSDAKVPFTIKVIDTEDVNAFALPGGFFFVNSGLILKADTEAELAGVMAHEIAHVAARHGTRQATRGEVAQLATIPLIFMGGWTGYGIRQAASVLIPVGFLQLSKAFESEADMLGLQYMYQTMLKERPEYVVTTSEFNEVKARLAMLHNKRRIDQKDPNRPQLRRAPGAGTTPTDGDGASTGSSDDRPTLKRAPGSNQ